MVGRKTRKTIQAGKVDPPFKLAALKALNMRPKCMIYAQNMRFLGTVRNFFYSDFEKSRSKGQIDIFGVQFEWFQD